MKSSVSLQLKGKVSHYPRAGSIPSWIAELSHHLRAELGRTRINDGLSPGSHVWAAGLGRTQGTENKAREHA